MKPGDQMYLPHPDEVETVTLLERGFGGFNLKPSYRARLKKPWVIRNRHGEEGVVDESWLYRDPLAASIRSAELMEEAMRENPHRNPGVSLQDLRRKYPNLKFGEERGGPIGIPPRVWVQFSNDADDREYVNTPDELVSSLPRWLSRRRNPRGMPQEAIDRNIAQDIATLEQCGMVPEGHWGEVKDVLTWLRGNEMSMIAGFFVDSLCSGKFHQFYIDDRVSGRPVSSGYSRGRVTKRDVTRAIRSLMEMKYPRSRSNPSSRVSVRIYPQTRTAGYSNLQGPREPTHYVVAIFTPSGNTWETSWAAPAPSKAEAIEAWRQDTNSGKRASKNWERR